MLSRLFLCIYCFLWSWYRYEQKLLFIRYLWLVFALLKRYDPSSLNICFVKILGNLECLKDFRLVSESGFEPTKKFVEADRVERSTDCANQFTYKLSVNLSMYTTLNLVSNNRRKSSRHSRFPQIFTKHMLSELGLDLMGGQPKMIKNIPLIE